MNRVSDILSYKGDQTVSVSPATSVLDALKIMAEKNIGSVIVMDSSNYNGIVTERDYSRKVVLKDKHSSTTPVSEIMTTDLPHVLVTDTIEHCMNLMTQNGIRYLPVFVGESFKGIISMSDVVKQTILSQQETINHLNEYIRS
jgi:CBS domain-containing protein